MRFVCSLNKKVVRALHKTTGKIEQGGDFSAFNSGWNAEKLDVHGIALAVGERQGLCAWHLVDGKREKNNTEPLIAGLIIIDIDNQADGKDKDGNKIQKQELTWDQAKELDLCKKYLSLAYDSPSGTDSWPRFRLVFGLEKEIHDPDFYQWFTRKIAKQIPGSDIRATSAVNLFYGAKEPQGILYTSDNFIPADLINDAQKHYATLPAEEQGEKISVQDTLSSHEVDERGADIKKLCTKRVQEILDGENIEDRSHDCTKAVKEILGWSNWLKNHGIPTSVSPLTVAHDAFYAIYEYPAEGDGKFGRIVESIRDADTIEPACVLASEHAQLAAWKRLRSVNRDLFEAFVDDLVKDALEKTKPEPLDSVLHLEDLWNNLEEEAAPPTPKQKPKQTQQTMADSSSSSSNVPNTPAQLVNLSGAKQQAKKYGENDVAELIHKISNDNILYDSTQDNFFVFSEDKGVWLRQDETHIKKRIINVLKPLVTAGLITDFKSSTINSVYNILQSELLLSTNEGTESVFKKGRTYIPFANGALCTKTMDFTPGQTKDLYFRDRHPYDWDAKAKCPKFLNWLDNCLRPGQTILIQAFCRALITGYTAGERFLHLVGPGRTGKSTMQQLLMALAGYNGTQATTLEQIETNKFETFNIMGKRLVLLSDESNYNKRMDTLKKLTSASDTIRAEKKYGKDSFQFKPECLVCIASNEHISSGDSTSGLERRRLTIVMDKVVDPGKVKELLSVYPDCIDGEFVPELPGIVSWALSMPETKMRSVLANPVIHAPSLAQTDIEALIFNNVYVAWLMECTLYAPNTVSYIGYGAGRPNTEEQEKGMYVGKAYEHLYASYANFCKQCGYKPSAKPRFVERVMETLNNILKLKGCHKTQRNGLPGIKGLRLKAFELTSDGASLGQNRLPNPVEFAQNPDYAAWKHAFDKYDAA